MSDFVDLKHAVREAGFPQYPAPLEGLEEIAERFTGAQPSNADPKDIRATFAWVLVQFAKAEHARQHYMSVGDAEWARRFDIQLGRLVEWWVWRRGGYDRHAVSGTKHWRNTRAARQRAVEEDKARIRQILAEILRLKGEGHSLDQAFARAAENGFGASKGANKALYYRRRRKLLREARE